MREEDIPKTTFRIHEGQVELLVMPLGINDEPSTSQILMNSIFEPFLRKIVWLSIEDMLIYRKYWKEDVHHVTIRGETTIHEIFQVCFWGS
jgi:hypothetical protein